MDNGKEDGQRSLQDGALLSLSDEVLIHILQYVSANDLLALSSTCVRLHNLYGDKDLWISVDFNIPFSVGKLTSALKYLHASTRSLKIRGLASLHPIGKHGVDLTLTMQFLRQLGETCQNLERLTVFEGLIDLNMLRIRDFPTTLTSLVFYRCLSVDVELAPDARLFVFPRLFFSQFDGKLRSLKEVQLDSCRWVDSGHLNCLSKVPTLKILSLRDSSSANGSLPFHGIARLGFTQLEDLDFSGTMITNNDLQSFRQRGHLKQLTLDCPPTMRFVENKFLVADSGLCTLRPLPFEETELTLYPILERLAVRYYNLVTDALLEHMTAYAPKLRFLDVTGTSVTVSGVGNFRSANPECQLISSFD